MRGLPWCLAQPSGVPRTLVPSYRSLHRALDKERGDTRRIATAVISPSIRKTVWHACHNAAKRASIEKRVHPHTLRLLCNASTRGPLPGSLELNRQSVGRTQARNRSPQED